MRENVALNGKRSWKKEGRAYLFLEKFWLENKEKFYVWNLME